MLAQLVNDFEEFEEAPAGAVWLYTYAEAKAQHPDQACAGLIWNKCPGCGQAAGMVVYEEPLPKPQSPSWSIVVDHGRITLAPSVDCRGCCGWHGYLRNGVWTT